MFRRSHPADHLLLLRPGDPLLPDESARVDAHLAGCPRCRVRRARLQPVPASIQTARAVPDDMRTAHHAASRARLQATLRRAAAGRGDGAWRIPAFRWLPVARSPLPLAAAVLLAVLGLQLALPLRDGASADMRAERDARPVPVFTPGAVSTLDARALCAGERPSRVVSVEARDQVLAEYRMLGVPPDAYELDALITPELGGTTARANLWPQRYDAVWNARVKDGLESLLAARVCAGTMPLQIAQDALARDWIGAYRHYFRTDAPLPSHLAAVEFDDELTVAEPALPGLPSGATRFRLAPRTVRLARPAPAGAWRLIAGQQRAPFAPSPSTTLSAALS